MRVSSTILILFLLSISAFCQNEFKKWNIGIAGGITQYNGDRGMEFYSSSQSLYGFGSLSLSRYVSNHFQVNFVFTSGEVGNKEIVQPWTPRGDKTSFRAKLNSYNLNFQYNITGPRAVLRPYLYMGVGILHFPKKYTNAFNRTEYALPNLGLGLNIRLTEFISLRLQENFMYTTADDLDFEVNDLNDSYLFHSAGLYFNLGKSRDGDDDGIPDARDKCPHSKGFAVDRNGCPADNDDDGIPDYLDYCPGLKGLAAFHGCPDKDNDGVADKDDACPDVAGSVKLKGCPDSDGDGVKDTDDKCPDTKTGYAVGHNGCPLDNDGDGVVNEEDQCPNLEGESFLKGCPDTDGDSIADINDRCPHEKGTKENKGCATISGEDARKLDLIASKIYFEKNSAKLTPASYIQLDGLVSILKKYNAVTLIIEGHSDEGRTKQANMELSQRRSEAVKDYLLKKGVAETRMSCVGYGDEKPQADADSFVRGKNRRVELKTIY